MEFLELAYETYQNAPGILKQHPVSNAYFQYAEQTNTFHLITMADGPDKDVAVFCFAVQPLHGSVCTAPKVHKSWASMLAMQISIANPIGDLVS